MTIDVTKRILVKVDGDTKGGQQGLVALNKEALATKLGLNKLANEASAAEKALNTIGLGANNSISGLQKLTNSLQGMTGKIGSGINAIDAFAKSLAPWNQALELGGKALGFADDAMSAFAKTSPEAAKRVAEIRDEFTKLKDAVMAAAGEIVVGAIELLSGAISGLTGSIGDAAENALPTLADAMERVNRTLESAKLGYELLTPEVLLVVQAMKEQADIADRIYWAGVKVGDYTPKRIGKKEAAAIQRAERDEEEELADLEKYGWDFERIKAEQQKAMKESARWQAEWEAERVGAIDESWTKDSRSATAAMLVQRGISDRNRTDANLMFDRAGASGVAGADGAAAMQQALADRQKEMLDARLDWIDEGPTLLERMGLDDPGEFDAAKSALETMGGALEAFGGAYQMTLKAIGEGEMSAAEIAKKGLAAMITGIADTLAAKSAAELVTGAAMLATLNPKGGLHLVAGGIYGAGAVAAYAAAAKLGGGASSKPSAGGGGGSGSGAGGGSQRGESGQSSGAQGTVTERVIVYAGDSFSEDTGRMKQIRAEKLIGLAGGTTAGSNR